MLRNNRPDTNTLPDKVEREFLDILSEALHSGSISSGNMHSGPAYENWAGILQLADIHRILPLIMEVSKDQEKLSDDSGIYASCKEKAINEVVFEVRRTALFLDLYRRLINAGIRPLILKGIAVRHFYLHPYHRPSIDEDLFVSPEEFPVIHRIMTEYGMKPLFPEKESEKEHETSYISREKGLYVEVHRTLFSEESETCGSLNRYFNDLLKKSITYKIPEIMDQTGCILCAGAGTEEIFTMEPTQHLLYLVCHAYKHFLYSGFGIRQVCDIAVFGTAEAARIDWEFFWDNCRKIHIQELTAAILGIAEKHLCFLDLHTVFRMPKDLGGTDELPLLKDILESGLHGASSMARLHSSSMTLDAVASAGKGSYYSGLWHSLFPKAEYLKNNYPYAKAHPVLLPAAWLNRLLSYMKQDDPLRNSGNTLRIGRKRIELLKKYKIL